MSNKHCPHCHCNRNAIKFGVINGKQRYKCRNCNKTFSNKKRPQKIGHQIWQDFVWRNFTVDTLSTKYHRCPNTIRKILNNYPIIPNVDLSTLSADDKKAIKAIMMDTTYFGRNSGYLVVIDAHNGKLLYFKEIDHGERSDDYEEALNILLAAGIRPKACVIDGRMGVKQLLEKHNIIPQHCLFHVRLFARTCLTLHPILEPNKELRNIIDLLCKPNAKITQEQFEHVFYSWKIRHEIWLQERTKLENGKTEFTHKNTRKLVNFLKKNMDYFFNYQAYPELHIPHTTNRLEGKFGNIKTKLVNHRGYTKSLRTKITFSFLSGETGV